MFAYILKVSICWLVFYLVYTAFLSKETFFRTNRWYLLGTLLLGAGIPLLEYLPVFQEDALAVVYIQPLSDSLHNIQITVNEAVTEASLDWMQLFWWVYLGGVSVCFSRFLFGLGKIFSLYKSGEVIHNNKHTLVLTDDFHLPFSFFNYLFWSKTLPLDDADGKKIITHEEAHVSGWHSVDVLLLEILSIIFWISPMVYFYKKSLKAVHEYLADAAVLQTTQTKQYGHLLLRQSQSGLQVALANHFFHSQLKQRIVMMTRSKSQRHAMAKYLFAVPVFLFLFVLFSKKEVTAQVQSDQNIETLDEVTVVGMGNHNNATTKNEFDPEKVKKELNTIATTFEKLDNDSQRTKFFIDYKKQLEKLLRQYPNHSKELFKISSDVLKENNITLPHAPTPITSTGEPIYKVVEIMPQFPGCDDVLFPEERKKCAEGKLMKYIYNNIQYPKAARDADISGTVILQFIVQKDGSIAGAKVLRSPGGGCGEESLRIVNSMPKWIPGKQGGKAVNVQFTLPIRFKLEGESKKSTDKLTTEPHPLIVVDGVVYGNVKNTEDLNIDPDQIESVSVFKGEKAIEKFGEKGKNGVIDIITKQGDFKLDTSDKVFRVVEEMPRFIGCESVKDKQERKKCAETKMLKFIYSNIKYPKVARENCIEGKVIVKFVIDKEGNVTQPELLRDIGGGCGKETLRVLDAMPKWIPGKQNGKVVNVQYVLPVKFKVDCSEPKKAVAPTPTEKRQHPVLKKKELEKMGFTYIKVSPNPTDGIIDIEYGSRDEKMVVTITDVNGKEVFRKEVPGGQNNIRNVNVKDAAKGMLLVTFRQGENVYTEKVILQ